MSVGDRANLDRRSEFAEFFAAGWEIGARDPERFFGHFEPRIAADAPLIQPLAPERRGPDGLRRLFEPLFEAIPDLHGEMVRWGATDDGIVVELVLRSPASGVEWTTLDVIELRGNVIAGRRAYFDPLPLLASLLRRPRTLAKLLPPLLRDRARNA